MAAKPKLTDVGPNAEAFADPAPAAGRPEHAPASGGGAPSPARMLQAALAAEIAMAPEPAGEKKWPPALTAAFILVTCGGFWAVVAFLVMRAFA